MVTCHERPIKPVTCTTVSSLLAEKPQPVRDGQNDSARDGWRKKELPDLLSESNPYHNGQRMSRLKSQSSLRRRVEWYLALALRRSVR